MSFKTSFMADKLSKPTKKEFHLTNFTETEMLLFYKHCRWWDDTKELLKHKNCPLQISLDVLTSERWYERLTAILAKPNREFMWKHGLTDKKSTVRAATYKTAICLDLENKNTIIDLILKDEWTKGYFRGFWDIERLKSLRDGTLTMEDWAYAYKN